MTRNREGHSFSSMFTKVMSLNNTAAVSMGIKIFTAPDENSNLGPTIEIGATSAVTTTQFSADVQDGPVLMRVDGFTIGKEYNYMAIDISVVGSPLASYVLGIYADNGLGTYPAALLAQTASTSMAIGYNWIPLTSTATITTTRCWLAIGKNQPTGQYKCSGTGGNGIAVLTPDPAWVTYPTLPTPYEGTDTPISEIVHMKITGAT